MVKDEYEILAFNDLNVAHAYLDTLAGVLRSLTQENSPLSGDLEKAYLGLSEFTYKYKFRLDDIASISGKIDEARAKHRDVIAKNSDLVQQNAELAKHLTLARGQCLELQEENESLFDTGDFINLIYGGFADQNSGFL